MDYESTRKVLHAFESRGVKYVVFGGAALNLLGLARFTEDLDVFIEPTRENVENLKAALHSVFDDPSIAEITADDLLGDYPAIQYVPPEGTFHIDILTRLGEAFRFVFLTGQGLTLLGLLLLATVAALVLRRLDR